MHRIIFGPNAIIISKHNVILFLIRCGNILPLNLVCLLRRMCVTFNIYVIHVQKNHHHHHHLRQPLCPVVGRRPQHAVSNYPVLCAVLSHIVSLQYVSRTVSPPLGWSPLSSFPVICQRTIPIFNKCFLSCWC